MVGSFGGVFTQMENLWEGVLSVVIVGMQSTVHITLVATPMQLVFGWYAILNIPHETNWQLIKKHKQELACKNDTRENKKRVAHTYKSEGLVLVKNKPKKIR